MYFEMSFKIQSQFLSRLCYFLAEYGGTTKIHKYRLDALSVTQSTVSGQLFKKVQ